jgi:hypothetical protein
VRVCRLLSRHRGNRSDTINPGDRKEVCIELDLRLGAPEYRVDAERCQNGPAEVETQHSFVNQLVGFLTLGIYTPMEIKVTCANQ